MVPAARWLVVALLALGVCAPPIVLRMLPVSDSDVSAAALAGRLRTSTDIGWTGEVLAHGSVSLPLGGSTFGGLARVLGGDSQLRVWWRDSRRWRIDRISTTGEDDLLRLGGTSIRWKYENSTARLVTWSPVRLPDDNDVVPAALATRLLDGARPSELSRLPARRVAGRSALGLRLVPADTRSTIARVDIWADSTSGVPLEVDVYDARSSAHPVLSTRVITFHAQGPSDRQVSFEFSPDVNFEHGTSFDVVASANAFAPFLLPSSLAGLDRRGAESGLGAVGVYGRGPTSLIAVPLRDEVARQLDHQIDRSRNARKSGRSVALDVGPLSVLLVRDERGNFLLIGTLTPGSLREAAADLTRSVVRLR